MDDERLKNGRYFGKDYFQELLERIRSIRTSERRIYLQITDIFAECSIDYNKNSETAKEFFATIQNKFHFAITGKTAAEIIYEKANARKEKMGLLSWKNSPKGRILKSDTIIAKNYLEETEIKKLERTVSSYFDYIERMIEARTAFTMEKLAESINKFLQFNKFEILDGKGKISHERAEQKAFDEYDFFNKTQKLILILKDISKNLIPKNNMLDQTTKRKLDSARQILVGKVPDPKAQVEQITTALIYKFMDDMDKENEEVGLKTQFFVDDWKKFSWTKILDNKLSGQDRLDLYVQAITNMPKIRIFLNCFGIFSKVLFCHTMTREHFRYSSKRSTNLITNTAKI